MLAVILLFVLMLLLMLMRVYLPIGTKPTGKVAKVIHLGLTERVLLQRINVYALGIVLLLMTVAGVIPAIMEIFIVLIAIGLINWPVNCLFTSDGVGINNVVFRPWSEFTSFSVERRQVVLAGRNGERPLRLPLVASHQKEAADLLRRHLSESGKTPRPNPRRAPSAAR